MSARNHSFPQNFVGSNAVSELNQRQTSAGILRFPGTGKHKAEIVGPTEMGDLTQERFDRLLEWLDTDRNAAALRYEKIRLRMIKIFASRGCCDAETLGDETIDRVAAKIDWLIPNYVGDPMLYFYGVGQNVYKESVRKKSRPDLPPPALEPTDVEEREQQLECLDTCMAQLPEDNASLAIRYYKGEKQAKIYNRKQLAAELGISLDALRIRAHRIRLELRKCVLRCLEEAPAN